MYCTGCGFSYTPNEFAIDKNIICEACGDTVVHETSDFLLHGICNIVREKREGQIKMAQIVEDTMLKERIALIEGPVGIGKSFAYLLPAILAPGRTVISTAKKQLQKQLIEKDIPYLSDKLKIEVVATLVKGKNNYACKLKAYDLPPKQREPLLEWIKTSSTGDLSDYKGEKTDATAEDCIGLNCNFKDTCGYWQNKQKIKTAKIIVANHHITAFDLRGGPGKMFGHYHNLVIDEAHQAASAFRSAYGQTITPFGAKRILQALETADINTGLEKRLLTAWNDAFKQIEHLDGEIAADPFGEAGAQVLRILGVFRTYIRDKMKVRSKNSSSDEDVIVRVPVQGSSWEEHARLEMLQKLIDRHITSFHSVEKPDPNTVVYITTTDHENKIVSIAPITVGPMIGQRFQELNSVIVTSATIANGESFDDIKYQLGLNLSTRISSAAPNIVASPSNLSGHIQSIPSGGYVHVPSLRNLSMSISSPKEITENVLKTPFDYDKQALLFTPRNIPLSVGDLHPDRKIYINALGDTIRQLLYASDGNAFILFTATSDLNDINTYLQNKPISNQTFISQGYNAEAALSAFMDTPRSSILGLKSFWEGVDVQGDKLRLVIIPKLPFPQINDPVIQARSRIAMKAALENGRTESQARGDVFRKIQIPLMLTDLRQGAGRLIRSKTDKGVLAILDPRIWTGSSTKLPTSDQGYEGYGAITIKALGFKQTTSDLKLTRQVLENLKKKRA